MVMKRFFFIILSILTLSLKAQNYTVPSIPDTSDYTTKVFIDFSAPNGGDGTIENPYNGFEDFTPQYGYAYLFKAGTVSSVSCYEVWNHNYVGKYGTGNFPQFKRLSIRNNSQYVVFDSIEFRAPGLSGNSGSIIRMEDSDVQQDGVVFANCKVIGTDGGYGYPGYGIRGGSSDMIFYHCEIGYTYSDNFLGNSLLMGGTQFVSCYFHHANLGSVINPATPGDALQIENGVGNGLYIANCWFDRSTTIWKFALILNSTMANATNTIVEWNTFIGPLPGKGGATIRWLAGTDNKFNKNLTYTVSGISCMESYDAFTYQSSPYGVRDNHWVGAGTPYRITGLFDSTSYNNIQLTDETAYISYLTTEAIDRYGSDIDTSNYWTTSSDTNWCAYNPMSVSATVGNDTNNRGVGSIDIIVTGGNGSFEYLWSNAETTQDITGLTSGQYSVLITDDSSCTTTKYYDVAEIDTSTSAQFLNFDSIYANLEDGENIDSNAIDGNYGTRWSANLDSSRWVGRFDGTYILDSIYLAFFKDTLRNTFFSVYTSLNGIDWTLVLTDTSAGNTLALQHFNVTNSVAKYIMIEGYGNNQPTAEEWTSITEIRAIGDTGYTCESIVLSASVVNKQNGGSDGYIDLTATGGTGSLSYLWSTTATTQDIYNLSAGTYSVIVTDDSSCTASATYNVYTDYFVGTADTVNRDTIFINFTTSSYIESGWVNWYTGSSISLGGTESIEISGANADNSSGYIGFGPYPDNVMQTAWYETDIGFDLSMALNDSSQYIYDIVVIGNRADYPAFELYTQFKIGNDSIEQYVEQNTTVDTFKSKRPDADGNIILNVNDGPSSGGGSGRITALVIIRREITGGTFYTYPLAPSATVTNNLCYGDSLGSIIIDSVYNGVYPYTHSWDIDSTTSSISGLIAGTYHDTIIDANDTMLIKTYIITQPDSIYYQLFKYDPVNYQNDGQLRIHDISGGSGSYSIIWEDSTISLSRLQLDPGDYWAIITDGNGCQTDTIKATLVNQGCDTINTYGHTIADTSGTSKGAITIDSITGGTIILDYSYAWADSIYTKNRTSVHYGTYILTVFDDNSCSDTDTFIVSNYIPPCDTTVFLFDTLSFIYDTNNRGQGSIVLGNFSGGDGNYSFLWDDSSTDSLRTGLSASAYNITITDGNGCNSIFYFSIGNVIIAKDAYISRGQFLMFNGIILLQ